MTLAVDITITKDELLQALQDPGLIEVPLKDFLYRSALTVEGQAKMLAPVDTGRLRASITTFLEPRRAMVSATAFYAPYVEYGTRPHFPPVSALRPWAKRHGNMSAWALARAIARRGTRPHPFMAPGARASLSSIQGFLSDMAEDIATRWRAAKHG